MSEPKNKPKKGKKSTPTAKPGSTSSKKRANAHDPKPVLTEDEIPMGTQIEGVDKAKDGGGETVLAIVKRVSDEEIEKRRIKEMENEIARLKRIAYTRNGVPWSYLYELDVPYFRSRYNSQKSVIAKLDESNAKLSKENEKLRAARWKTFWTGVMVGIGFYLLINVALFLAK